MRRNNSWLLPLTGVIGIALVVVGFIILGEGQDATDKTAQEIAQFYQDNEDSLTLRARSAPPARAATGAPGPPAA